MYAYFAITASGHRVPRTIAKCITIIQLLQMMFGIFINYVGMRSLLNNKICKTNWFAISISILLFISYIILFVNFFYQAYILKKSSSPIASPSTSALEETIYTPSLPANPKVSQTHTVNGLRYCNGKQ